MNFSEALLAACSELDLRLSCRQLEQATAYADLLLQWSERLSLTTVRDPADLARFHFAEAFWGARHFVDGAQRIADIGSGTGFPGMAVKIYRPDLQLSLLERNTKKAVFLETVQARLGLPVEVCRISAEEWNGWEKIDLAMMRAVKADRRLLRRLSELDVPLLIFQAAESSPLPESWTCQRSFLYPLSHQRVMKLWRYDVSRETR